MTRPWTCGRSWALVLCPAAVTALVYIPQLLTNPEQTRHLGMTVNLAWVVLLFAAAPATARTLTRRRSRQAGADARLLHVGLAQLVTAVILVRLDTWLEVRSGYLLAGSGEEAMSYGLGLPMSIVGGALLAALTVAAARVPARPPCADGPG